MLKIKNNIILLGTSHVSKQSQKEILETINKYEPEVIGIELDLKRFKTLMSKKPQTNKPSLYQTIKEFGTTGAIFGLIAGYMQTKIGKKLNIDPGIDMKTAYKIAREKKIPTSLIDQDIKITLKNMSKLSFFKKFTMFTSITFKSFQKKYKQKLNFNIKNGVPEEKVVTQLISLVKREVPDLYNILIDDRNKYMVKRLLKLKEKHDGYILAVVGAGHVEGMAKLLDKEFPEKSSQTILEHKFIVEIKKN